MAWLRVFAILAALVHLTSVKSEEDRDVVEFRASLALAIKRDDFEALRTLADDSGRYGPVLTEIASLQAVLDERIAQAFQNAMAETEDPGALLALASKGQANGAAASDASAAQAKARLNMEARITEKMSSSRNDADVLREVVAVARAAGADADMIRQVEDQLVVLAKQDLQAAMDEGDASNLVDAVARATQDGVPSSEVTAAATERNQRLQAQLSAASGTGDLQAKADAIRIAERLGDSSFDVLAQALKEELAADISAVFAQASGLVKSDLHKVHVALELAREVGLESAAGPTAQLVASQDAKESARAALAVATTERDWWAMVDCIASARGAGLDEAEVAPAAALLSEHAAAALQAASTDDTTDLDDLQMAFAMGMGAGLPTSSMSAVKGRLEQAARDRLVAASGPGGTLTDVRNAMMGRYLPEAEIGGAQDIFRAKVDAWAEAGGGSTASDALRDLQIIRSMEGLLTPTQMETAKGVFRDRLFRELAAARDAVSLPLLNDALRAAAQGDVFLIFDENSPMDRDSYGTLLTSARDVRTQEQLKADAIQRLQEVAESIDISELEAAVSQARAAGVDSSVLSGYETALAARQAESGNALDRLVRATGTGTAGRLRDAIQQGEAAGLVYSNPEAMQNARAALEVMEAQEAATTTTTTLLPPSLVADDLGLSLPDLQLTPSAASSGS